METNSATEEEQLEDEVEDDDEDEREEEETCSGSRHASDQMVMESGNVERNFADLVITEGEVSCP